jgi:hypothetical protein
LFAFCNENVLGGILSAAIIISPPKRAIDRNYNSGMARGWESKSIEAQQEEASSKPSPDKPRLTRKEADRFREKESLRLSLRRITEQIDRSQNSRHRQMLQQAKIDLERQIETLKNQSSQ